MSTMIGSEPQLQSIAWFKGVENAAILADEATDETPIEDIRRQLGIFVCRDGLCQGLCIHSLNAIQRINFLSNQREARDFANGAEFVLNGVSSVMGSSNV